MIFKKAMQELYKDIYIEYENRDFWELFFKGPFAEFRFKDIKYKYNKWEIIGIITFLINLFTPEYYKIDKGFIYSFGSLNRIFPLFMFDSYDNKKINIQSIFDVCKIKNIENNKKKEDIIEGGHKEWENVKDLIFPNSAFSFIDTKTKERIQYYPPSDIFGLIGKIIFIIDNFEITAYKIDKKDNSIKLYDRYYKPYEFKLPYILNNDMDIRGILDLCQIPEIGGGMK